MNSLGNYFVACVVFSAIMNRTPEGATGRIVASDGGVFIDLPTSTAAALQQIAWTTLSTYRSTIATIAPKAPGSFTVQ
jgi:drug/metabolite transporter superfamily protein YnfA